MRNTFIIPACLRYVRSLCLPKYRRSAGYDSIADAESDLIMEKLNAIRAAVSHIPPVDFVSQRFADADPDDALSAVALYEKTVRELVAPSNWGFPLTRVTVRLHEEPYSAMAEVALGRALPLSMVYTLAVCYYVPDIAPAEYQFARRAAQQVSYRLHYLLDTVAQQVSHMRDIVRLPDYLRVATFLEPGKRYTQQSIAVLAISLGIIHGGHTPSERARIVGNIVAKLLEEGYLIADPSDHSTYTCVKRFVLDDLDLPTVEGGGD